MSTLSRRERRLIALGLLAVAVALAWLAIVRPIVSGFAERQARREQAVADHARNQRLIAAIPDLRRMAERRQAIAHLHAIAAPDAEQGAELLRERLEASVDASGAQLRGSESVEAPPGWVRARVSAAMPEPRLAQWLARLSSTPPYLALESLSIGTARDGARSPSQQLDVTLEASLPLAQTNTR